LPVRTGEIISELMNSKPVRLLTASILDLPFKSLADEVRIDTREQAIPGTVYQTWEQNKFGRRHWNSLRQFRSLNHDLSFVLFDAQQRDSYMFENWKNTKILDAYVCAKIGPLKADIFRYCILYDRGGYYFDISKGIGVPITSLHDVDTSVMLTYESHIDPSVSNNPDNGTLPNLFAQWGLGFSPGHPILANQIAEIESRYSFLMDKICENPKQSILELSGPISFSRNVREHIAAEPGDYQICGVDFYGQGIFSLKGSGSRYLLVDSYSKLKYEKILSSSMRKSED
jgi:mannosyltransferase OCH1-like enzyme